MNKIIALFVAAAVLAPVQASAVVNQCHKSTCPPISTTLDRPSPTVEEGR